MAKVLVVYYSRTGYTRRVATEIASQCGADTDEIRDHIERTGLWGYLRSGREALRRAEPAIEPAAVDPAGYDVVVLGTPVWASNVAPPLRSYLRAHARKLPRVAFFCTQGGSGAGKVLADLAALCEQPAVATLVLNDAAIDRGQHVERVRQFVAAFCAATV